MLARSVRKRRFPHARGGGRPAGGVHANDRAQGAVDLPLLQKYLNFWCSSSLDLFGAEISSNAANSFASGAVINSGTLAVGDATHPGATLAGGVTLAGGAIARARPRL